MKHTVVHDEDEATVRRAADSALVSYGERFPAYCPEAVWTTPEHADISFQVGGKVLHGTFDIRPRAIDLEVEVPLYFRIFRDRAIRVVEAEIRKWLTMARSATQP